MLDFGKLIFAGIVLAGIFDSNVNKTILIWGGIVLCAAVVWYGIHLSTQK